MIKVLVFGQDCERTLPLCLDSVQGADEIIYIDGGSEDNSMEIAKSMGCTVVSNKFENPGLQKRFGLDYLRSRLFEGWVLHLDSDEFIDDFNKVKFFVERTPPMVLSVKMRHFVYNLGYEDSVYPEHYAPTRLFYMDKSNDYLEGEHVMLKSDLRYGNVSIFCIYHLAYCGGIYDIHRRYIGQKLRKAQNPDCSHPDEFIEHWYRAHLFGGYPVSKVDLKTLPPILLKHFNIDPDEIYFSDRNLETKHFMEANAWKKFFVDVDTITEYGCGLGPRVYALQSTKDWSVVGIELSEWAVNHKIKDAEVHQGDLLDEENLYTSDLVIAYDVLEHIEYKNLDLAINNLIRSSNKWLLISVPIIGDPNLEADPTHKIKETKEWWIEKFKSRGLTQVETPHYFPYNKQIMIFHK